MSNGYKMVVLTRDPMAPEVASDIDSKSTPIFDFTNPTFSYIRHLYIIYSEREVEASEGGRIEFKDVL